MAADALSRVRDRGHIGIRLGLARMQALLAQLGDPQTSLHGALIGGTNGKGSAQAMVAAVLIAAGHRVLQSPSPHLSSYRERIVVDGMPISGEALDATLAQVIEASVPGEDEHGPATQFELLTAAAFLWGARAGVDVAVIEVGLGGRLDATNTWTSGVAAITNVGLDHQEYLGDTFAAVAAEKAAIIKPSDVAVTGAEGDALAVISRHCQELGVPLRISAPLGFVGIDAAGTTLRDDRLGLIRTPLLGRFQAANAAVALGVIDALEQAGLAGADETARREGLAKTHWPGRMELLDADGLTVLLDGAHNPDGARTLAETFEDIASALPEGRVTLMLGVMADKDVAAMLSALTTSPRLAASELIASGVPGTDRALPASALDDAWAERPGSAPTDSVLVIDDADAALDRAMASARNAGGPLVVAGSLYLVGHVRARLRPDEHDRDR
jgi:dihydrofolate synthase/folylpolyglutamate synthase